MLDEYRRPRPVDDREDGPIASSRDTAHVNSFLDQGTEFDGKLAFEGAVRINGKFSGEIFSEGTLYVGETGAVNAEIQVDTVIISGEVNGDVVASSKVELHKSARLQGNIRSRVLKIEEGAHFEGNCQMNPTAAPDRKPAPVPEAEAPLEDEQKGLELS